MAVLTDEEVDAALPDLNGWERAEGALRRSIKFPTFLDGIDVSLFCPEHHHVGNLMKFSAQIGFRPRDGQLAA